MSIIVSKPISGREFHLYDDQGDGTSVCGRAPFTGPIVKLTTQKPTCAVCLRALNAIVKYKPKAHAA